MGACYAYRLLFIFAPEPLATTGLHWVELFTSLKVHEKNGYVDEEIITGALNDIGASGKWVKLQFWVTQPFQMTSNRINHRNQTTAIL